MGSLKDALWFFVFVFAVVGSFQTCAAFETSAQLARIADRMPSPEETLKRINETLDYRLLHLSDNLGRCGK